MQQTQALRGVCEDRGTAVARYVRTNRRDDGRHATGMYRPGPVAPSGHPARAARPASPARAAPLPARPRPQPERRDRANVPGVPAQSRGRDAGRSAPPDLPYRCHAVSPGRVQAGRPDALARCGRGPEAGAAASPTVSAMVATPLASAERRVRESTGHRPLRRIGQAPGARPARRPAVGPVHGNHDSGVPWPHVHWHRLEKQKTPRELGAQPVSEGGLEPPPPIRGLAPQASASAYSATRTG